jgi:hypothetical protein
LIHQEAASVGGLFHFPFAFSASTQNFDSLCRQSDSNLSRARSLFLLARVGVGIGRRIMAIFEKICVVSALTGFLVLIGATVALFVAA